MENASDSGLIPQSNDLQPLAAYAPVPPRRYENDLPLYSKLSVDKGKQRHPFGNRVGETRDIMMKQYKVKVPIPPKPMVDTSNTIIDGTVDMEETSQSYFENETSEDEHSSIEMVPVSEEEHDS